jgi:hypothetical protein
LDKYPPAELSAAGDGAGAVVALALAGEAAGFAVLANENILLSLFFSSFTFDCS